MNKQLRILADAICHRLRYNRDSQNIARPHEKMRLEAAELALWDVLGMLLASHEPAYPTTWCTLNICNNPARHEAQGYYAVWVKNGCKVM